VKKFEMQTLLVNEETLSRRPGQVLYSQLSFSQHKKTKIYATLLGENKVFNL
jgi:hypothetical protein